MMMQFLKYLRLKSIKKVLEVLEVLKALRAIKQCLSIKVFETNSNKQMILKNISINK